MPPALGPSDETTQRLLWGLHMQLSRAWQDCLDKSWPLILQTPAIGPIGDDPIFKSPPHFRWIEVDKIGTVLHAEVTSI